PQAGLVQSNDGNFYGTTQTGGAADLGTVFRITPTGILTTLVEFTGTGGANKGSIPYAGLVQGSDGNLYGTTSSGGASDLGTVFKMTSAGGLTTLVEFSGNDASNKGSDPVGGLLQGSDGNFYGTTSFGGANNLGTVFKVTTAGVLTTLGEFAAENANGSNPHANVVQGSDGNFYGATAHGGVTDSGTVFKVTPAGALSTMVRFTGIGGANK